jgi:putative ABC transport system permease protein
MVISGVLGRKILRDLFSARWQYLAIGAMVSLGVAFYIASYSAYVNLEASFARSYESLLFEDFMIQFHAAPERVAARLERLPGVAAVEGRLVEDVGVELPGRAQNRKLVGRLISIPENRELKVNRLKLVEGRLLSPRARREVLLEASFAGYHQLRPGDEIEAVRGTGRVRLRIAGIVQSPEYLYVVRSRQELMAVPDTFGVMFVSEDVLGPLVGKGGAINEIHIKLAPDAPLEPALRRAGQTLEAYRPNDPIPRTDQPSNQMLQQDVEGFRSYAILFPAFFLSVAVAAVYSLLTRLVHQQRPAIGLLRSLGYSRRSVLWHYLSGALALGLVAALVGDLLGLWLARWTSLLYMGQLQVPEALVLPRWNLVWTGLAIGAAATGLGALFPANAAARIRPAEAMRPLSPTFGQRSILLDRLFPGLKLVWKLPLRNIFRQPKRTFSTLFGIVAGIALMITARGLLDSTEEAIYEIVSGSYRYDLRLDLLRARDSSIVHRVRSWPGVVRAEGVLEVPVDLAHGGKTYSAMVSGQDPAAGLLELRDPAGQPIQIPEEGALFGPTLRKRLELEVGDVVQVSVPKNVVAESFPPVSLRVAGFTDEAIGTVAYLRRQNLWSLLREELELPPSAVSGVVIKVAPKYAAEVRSRLQKLPDAGSVLSVPEIRRMLERVMETFRIFVLIMELFGVALAVAMIFNMVTINVLERGPEIATLRTIGFGRRQIAAMVTFENLVVGLVGIAIGLPFGRWFIEQFWLLAQTEEQQELFTYEISVKPATYAISAVAILAAVLISQIPALRMLGRMDLAKATKERTS